MVWKLAARVVVWKLQCTRSGSWLFFVTFFDVFDVERAQKMRANRWTHPRRVVSNADYTADHAPLAATRASDPWLDQKRNEYDSPRPVTRERQTVHAPSIRLRTQHVGGASQTADNAHKDWKTQPKFAPSGYEGSPQRLVATKRTCKKDTCV